MKSPEGPALRYKAQRHPSRSRMQAAVLGLCGLLHRDSARGGDPASCILCWLTPGVYLQRPREGARTRSTSVGGSQDHCHGSHCARAGAADDPAPHAMQCKRLVAWQGSERAWVPGIFSIDGSLKQTRSDVRGRSSVSCLV